MANLPPEVDAELERIYLESLRARLIALRDGGNPPKGSPIWNAIRDIDIPRLNSMIARRELDSMTARRQRESTCQCIKAPGDACHCPEVIERDGIYE